MATSTTNSFVRRLSQSLACPVCLEIFRRPTVLPCGHTFCLDCIKSLPARNRTRTNIFNVANTNISCPVCRKSLTLTAVNALPQNFVAQTLISDMRKNDRFCCNCYRGKRFELASSVCRDCKKTACDACSQPHIDKGHEVESLVEPQCAIHRQPLELFCVQCRTSICVRCVSEHHRGHRLDSVDQAAEDFLHWLHNRAQEIASLRTQARTDLYMTKLYKERYERCLESSKSAAADPLVSKNLRLPELTSCQEQKSSGIVRNFMLTKMKEIKTIVQSCGCGKAIDMARALCLQQEVTSLLRAVVVGLDVRLKRLHETMNKMDKFSQQCIDDTFGGRTACDVLEKVKTVCSLDEKINVEICSLEEEEHFISEKNAGTTGLILSRENSNLFDQLLQQAAILRETLMSTENEARSVRIGYFTTDLDQFVDNEEWCQTIIQDLCRAVASLE